MRRGFERVVARGWVAVAAFLLAAVAQAAEPIPVKAFFEKPAISEATISPTGRHVAVVAANKEGREQLVIIDTATLKPFVAAASKVEDVTRVRWVSEKRLVYSLKDSDREHRLYAGARGVYAVDRDGTEHRAVTALTGFGGAIAGEYGYTRHLHATTWLKDSDSVFLGHGQTDSRGEFGYMKMSKVDTRTGAVTPIEGPPTPWTWYFGPGDVPRVAVSREEGSRFAIYHADPASHAWTKLLTYDYIANPEDEFSVVGYDGEDTLYVSQQPKGAANAGLYTYNVKTRKLSTEPILSAKGFDVHPVMIRSRDKILGLRYVTDAESTVWFDAGMKKAQAKVDALLPSTVNRISVPVRAEVPFVLVSAYSDTDPGQYFVYDLEKEKLVPLGSARPDIDPARMARRDFVRYKARDGLEIPAWVTRPKDGGQGPRPMVVLVHGGPYVRGGYWGWNADAEFLASRGYVVLEPEFRGSTGFGIQHFRAGWKQWGLAMQDDIADGARWAVSKGIADAKRICIAGASYGGYATLMGLVRDGDVYRCGVDWVGVTDIDLMYSITWSDASEIFRTYGMPALVADREKDAAQIKATSPIEQAFKIKQPLLLAYGGVDARVPIKHGTEFRDAVSKSNRDVEWIVYPDEGHGWSELKNNIDFWTRVEKFLARNIGDGAKQ
jgi:dipeptidyl aminopeptidase/acylaminoacyl peptidase